MSTTSKIAVTEGNGKNIATYSVAEDAATKEIQRVVPSTSSGTELGTSSAPVRTDPTGSTTQPVSAASLPLPSGAAQDSSVQALVSATDFDSKVGSLTETAPSTDTASSGLNGRLQRLAQRLTSLIALLPTSLTGSGNLKVALVESTATQTVSGTVTANIGTSGSLALETGGNLATIAGAVTSSKVAVKSASGDLADGALVTLGSKADAKSTATDTTAITVMQVIKQISASIQAAASSLAGTLTISGNVTPVPATSGGPTATRIKSAASTNATSVKASAGQVYAWYFYNNTSSAKFLKLYNKASSPTVGTDTPLFTVGIPANGGTNIEYSMGIPCGTGIAYAITGAVADSDTTSTAADDVHGVLLYK